MSIEEDALTHMRTQVRQRMNDITDDVATGACRSFEDYRHACGKIEGLAEAERILLDTEKELLEG